MMPRTLNRILPPGQMTAAEAAAFAAGNNLQPATGDAVVMVYDDLLFGSLTTLSSGFSRIAQNSGTSAYIEANQTTYGKRQGLLSSTIATNANSGSMYGWNGSGTSAPGVVLGIGRATFSVDFVIPALSDATDSFVVVAGFGDTAYTATPANGCLFSYTHDTNSGKFAYDTFNNSSPTVGPYDTGITVVPGTFYTLLVDVNAAGTQADFWIRTGLGTIALVGSRSTNIPTAAGRAVQPMWGLFRTSGSSNTRSVVTDRYAFRLMRDAALPPILIP